MLIELKKSCRNFQPKTKKKFKETITGIYVLGVFSNFGTNKYPEKIQASINYKLNEKTTVEFFEIANKIKQKMENRK